jgi:hypothetical protein
MRSVPWLGNVPGPMSRQTFLAAKFDLRGTKVAPHQTILRRARQPTPDASRHAIRRLVGGGPLG